MQYKIKMEIFTTMLLMQYFFFQIIPWYWKHLTNCKVQGKKFFWHMILHSYLCHTLCNFLIKIKSNSCFSKTYSEIERMWSINSSKEIVLSRDSKELFVQRFMKVFGQNWKHVHKIKEQPPQLNLLYRDRTVKSKHWRSCKRKLFLKICNIHRKHLCWSLFQKKVADF